MKASLCVIVLILLGLQCAYSVTTYFDSFTYNGTSGSLDLGGYSAVYPLGTLSAGYSLYATFSYPGIPATSTQLSTDITYLTSGMAYGLVYMDTSSGTVVKADGKSQSNKIIYPTPTNPGLYRMTHNI